MPKFVSNPPDASALMASARSFGNYDLAGAIADRLVECTTELNDEASMAIETWRAVASDLDAVPLAALLRSSAGGLNLLRTNQASDIDIAAEIDKFGLVPRLDVERWSIQSR